MLFVYALVAMRVELFNNWIVNRLNTSRFLHKVNANVLSFRKVRNLVAEFNINTTISFGALVSPARLILIDIGEEFFYDIWKRD